MAKKKVKPVLRFVSTPREHTNEEKIDIFEGDIKDDKKYWKKYQNSIARYFKLEEI